MDYFLSEEQKMIQELSRQIAQEKILPIAAELDEKEEFPYEIMQTLAEADLFRIFIPEEYGGLGGGVFELCLATEELSRVCSGVAVSFAATALGAYPIMLFGNEEQKEKYLPRIAGGELAAFGLTEPNAGSDAAAIETKAVLDGDSYVINGTKQWITNGGEAGIYTIFVLTDKSKGIRGISAIIVEKDAPGFSYGKKEKKMGIRASATRELSFRTAGFPAKTY